MAGGGRGRASERARGQRRLFDNRDCFDHSTVTGSINFSTFFKGDTFDRDEVDRSSFKELGQW